MRKLTNRQENRLVYLRKQVRPFFAVDSRSRTVHVPWDLDPSQLPGKIRGFLKELAGDFGYNLQQFIY